MTFFGKLRYSQNGILMILFVWSYHSIKSGQAQPATVQQGCNGTVLDLLNNTPDVSYTATWLNNVGYAPLVASNLINLTIFAPLDTMMKNKLPLYTGTPFDIKNTSYPINAIGLYNGIQGSYSEDQLVDAGAVNSVLGQLKNYDIPLQFSRASNGSLIVTGLGNPGDNTATIIQAQHACNGWLYTVNNLLLPANSSSQISTNYGDSVIVSKIFLDSSTCGPDVGAAILNVTENTTYQLLLQSRIFGGDIYKGIFSNASLAVTYLLPYTGYETQRDNSPGKNRYVNEPQTVLYNMLPGAYCPDELVQAGLTNTMLGAVLNTSIPLSFSSSGNNVVVTGSNNMTVKVLQTMVVCNSVILVTDGVLTPPDSSINNATLPTTFSSWFLPSSPVRHMTCNPVQYNATSSLANGKVYDEYANNNNNNNALIVGLAVGLPCAAIIVGVVIYLMLRWHWFNGGSKQGGSKKKYFLPSFFKIDSAPSHGNTGTTRSHGVPLSAITAFSNHQGGMKIRPSPPLSSTQRINSLLGSWQMDVADIVLDVAPNGSPILLGKGSFGSVYRGTINNGNQPVAIKVLSQGGREVERAFITETNILCRVNDEKHIVRLFGATRHMETFVLVMELMNGGDLLEAIANDSAGLLHWHRYGKLVALDIIQGLMELHASNVIHRDLKSKNVLLSCPVSQDDLPPLAKIADVGVSAIATHGYLTPSSSGKFVGTLAWSAPELLLAHRCSAKVDIFSFGIVLWEIATGQVPRRGFVRLPKPSEDRCPQGLIDVIEKCLDTDPRKRPTAKEVYQDLLLNIS